MAYTSRVKKKEWERFAYKRFCDRCGELFRPIGKQGRFCEDCKLPWRPKKK